MLHKYSTNICYIYFYFVFCTPSASVSVVYIHITYSFILHCKNYTPFIVKKYDDSRYNDCICLSLVAQYA